MTVATEKNKKPYFGLTGGWLTFWVTVACATDMSLFGYDQGVFSKPTLSVTAPDPIDISQVAW